MEAAPEGEGPPPNRWGHPYTPYAIQEDFMRETFEVLDSGGIGIFESPTGTGKSLSIICGAFTWLQAHLKGELAERDDASGGKPEVAEPDWVEEATREIKRQQRQDESALIAEQRAKRAKRLETARAVLGATQAWRTPLHAAPHKAPGGGAAADGGGAGADAFDAFLVRGDDDAAAPAARPFDASDEEGGADAAGGAPAGRRASAADAVRPRLQIVYASRTHSQLSQFVGEVRKTPFAASLSTVSLGSRKQLCVHEPVASLGSAQRVNDGCQALQRSAGAGCPLLHPRSAPAAEALRDSVLTTPADLEDLVGLGRSLGCCAYYGARGASAHAHVLLVPYSCLLHAQTREALGIELARSVVVMDEAHNLLDALNDLHSVALTDGTLLAAHSQLSRYLAQYERRLSGANRTSLGRLLRFVKAVRGALARAPAAAAAAAPPPADCAVVRVNEFLATAGVDHLNLWEVLAFCEGSQLARKVQGFVDAAALAEAKAAGQLRARGAAPAALATATYAVISLLRALTSSDADGRVLVTRAARDGDAATVKYLHLNPSVHLAPILSQAHAVLLAGGTMEPLDELLDAIRARARPGRPPLRLRSFGHVVPAANLLGVCVRAARVGEAPLQLVAATRARDDVLDSIGAALGECRRATASGGLIVFFASFAYLALARARWAASGALEAEVCAGGAALFEEPREAAALEQTLADYAAAIAPAEPGGRARAATLLSVVGGKMSEGINFADEMGRTVVMVGMPYPNPRDLELVERMAFLNARQLDVDRAAAGAPAAGGTAGQRYYEGLCMRAVNQSIGRVIRHARDYATIVLLDARYQHARVQAKLPKWIQQSLRSHDTAASAAAEMAAFFERHRRAALSAAPA